MGMAIRMMASLAVLLVGASGPATAAVRLVTYSGTLASGTDQTGLFGVAGADLAGLAITTRYLIDTNRGFRNTNPGVSDEVIGGTSQGGSTPVFRTTVTINGISRDLPGLTSSSAFTGLGFGRLFDSFEQIDTPLFDTVNAAGNVDTDAGSALAWSLETDVAPTAITLDTSYFQFTSFDKVNLVQSVRTFGEWNPAAIYSVSAAPEPAGWALLLAGFGLAGMTLRRQRGRGQQRISQRCAA